MSTKKQWAGTVRAQLSCALWLCLGQHTSGSGAANESGSLQNTYAIKMPLPELLNSHFVTKQPGQGQWYFMLLLL